MPTTSEIAVWNGTVHPRINLDPRHKDFGQYSREYYETGPEKGAIIDGPRTAATGSHVNYGTSGTDPSQGKDYYQSGRDGQINDRWNQDDDMPICRFHRSFDINRDENLLYHIPFKTEGDLIRASDLNNLQLKLEKQIEIWNAEIEDPDTVRVARGKLTNRLEVIERETSENISNPINTNVRALSVYKIDTTGQTFGKRKLFGDINHEDLTQRDTEDLTEAFDIQLTFIPILYNTDLRDTHPFAQNKRNADYCILEFRSADLHIKVMIIKANFTTGTNNITLQLFINDNGSITTDHIVTSVKLPELLVGQYGEITLDTEQDIRDFDEMKLSLIFVNGEISLWNMNDEEHDVIDHPGTKLISRSITRPSVQDGQLTIGGSLYSADKLNGDECTPMSLVNLTINRNQLREENSDQSLRVLRYNLNNYVGGSFESNSADRVSLTLYSPNVVYAGNPSPVASSYYDQKEYKLVGSREFPVITPEYWIQAKVTLDSYINAMDTLIIPGQQDANTAQTISQFKNLQFGTGTATLDEPSTQFMAYEPVSGSIIKVGFFNSLVSAYNLIVTNCICNADCACNQNCSCNVNCNCNYSDIRLKDMIDTKRDIQSTETDAITKEDELNFLLRVKELLSPKVWVYKDFNVFNGTNDLIGQNKNSSAKFGPIAQDVVEARDILIGLYSLDTSMVHTNKNEYIKLDSDPSNESKQYLTVDSQQVNECRIWIDNQILNVKAEIYEIESKKPKNTEHFMLLKANNV